MFFRIMYRNYQVVFYLCISCKLDSLIKDVGVNVGANVGVNEGKIPCSHGKCQRRILDRE